MMSDWISVEDRLPEAKEVVLVYCSKVYGEIYYEVEEPSIVKVEWESKECSYAVDTDCYDVCAKNITHWMPMPEPPEVNDYKSLIPSNSRELRKRRR